MPAMSETSETSETSRIFNDSNFSFPTHISEEHNFLTFPQIHFDKTLHCLVVKEIVHCSSEMMEIFNF
jgi:hypothetical protein